MKSIYKVVLIMKEIIKYAINIINFDRFYLQLTLSKFNE